MPSERSPFSRDQTAPPITLAPLCLAHLSVWQGLPAVRRYKPVTKWLILGGNRRQLLVNGVLVLPYLAALEELERP